MDPSEVRFTQDNVSREFSDGRTIKQLVNDLKTKPGYAAKVEPVTIMRDRGNWYTLDNRRVVAFQQANAELIASGQAPVQMPYRVATPADIQAARDSVKFTTITDGENIRIRDTAADPKRYETHRVPRLVRPTSDIGVIPRSGRINANLLYEPKTTTLRSAVGPYAEKGSSPVGARIATAVNVLSVVGLLFGALNYAKDREYYQKYCRTHLCPTVKELFAPYKPSNYL
jgi:hypothetical protein